MAEPVLALEGLTKRYGALLVSDAVSLTIAPGELHAVIGPNGAGKTTLIGQIAGALDHWTGGGAKTDAEFPRHDLRQCGLSQTRRAVQQHMVHRLGAGAGGLDEDGEVLAGGTLAGEIRQGLRSQGRLDGVFLAAPGVHIPAHRATSRRPSRMS